METDQRQLLSAQLEQQAQALREQDNNERLIVTLLSTCRAFLRAAESLMPEHFSYQEFQSIYAGYVGSSGRIKAFFEKNAPYIDSQNSQFLKDLLNSLKQAEEEQKRLDVKMQTAQRQKDAASAAAQKSQKDLEQARSSCEALIQKDKRAKDELAQLQKKSDSLREEIETVKAQAGRVETEVQELVRSVQSANDSYEEIKAYYSELDRMKSGLQEEGIVSVESFSDKVQEMNRQGSALMHSYDEILKNLNTDVAALKQKIEDRRTAGS